MNAYRQTITIEGTRGTSVPRVWISLPAEFMDGSMDEPLSDSCALSSTRRMTFVVKTKDLGGIVPRIGDRVTREDGSRFAVTNVQPFYSREFILDCRSC